MLVSVHVNCLLHVWSFVRIRKFRPIFSFLAPYRMAKNKLDDKANSNTTDDMVYDLSFHIIIIICISGKPAWCHKDKTIAQFLTFSFLIQPHPYCSCFQPDRLKLHSPLSLSRNLLERIKLDEWKATVNTKFSVHSKSCAIDLPPCSYLLHFVLDWAKSHFTHSQVVNRKIKFALCSFLHNFIL